MNLALMLGVAVGVSAPGLKDSPKAETSIVGEWVSVSVTFGGITSTSPSSLRYEFTAAGQWITRRDGVTERSLPDVYELDSKADPPSIDIGPLVLLGNGAPTQKLGIYKLEGDTLTICLGRDERPKTFESPDGSRNLLIVLKRVKKKD